MTMNLDNEECRACGCTNEAACTRCQQAKNEEAARDMQRGCIYVGCFVLIGIIIGAILILAMIIPIK